MQGGGIIRSVIFNKIQPDFGRQPLYPISTPSLPPVGNRDAMKWRYDKPDYMFYCAWDMSFRGIAGIPNRYKKRERRSVFSFLCDSCRIQTCNLLIRSQMLYSVELRSHLCVSGLSFPESECKSTTFFQTDQIFFLIFFLASFICLNCKGVSGVLFLSILLSRRTLRDREAALFREIRHRRVRILT